MSTKRTKRTTVVLMWDWKEQIDLAQLNKALRRFSKPVVVEVETGGDCFGVVVGERGLTKAQAQRAWDADWEND